MTFAQRLHRLREQKKSLLCIGLDPELQKLPGPLQTTPAALQDFCEQIIAASAQHAIAFKINFAFFERYGAAGWEMIARVREKIPADCIAIADAKRGDIGNSARHYAHAILTELAFDAVTVSPYMGRDSAEPFLEYTNRGIFFLGLTSNPGAKDIQLQDVAGTPLFMHVARLVQSWNRAGNCGLVAGATRPQTVRQIRTVAPDLPLLMPGVGAQGGDLQTVLAAAGDTNVLISASRSIIYAGSGADFARAAAEEAGRMHDAMRAYFSADDLPARTKRS